MARIFRTGKKFRPKTAVKGKRYRCPCAEKEVRNLLRPQPPGIVPTAWGRQGNPRDPPYIPPLVRGDEGGKQRPLSGQTPPHPPPVARRTDKIVLRSIAATICGDRASWPLVYGVARMPF
jgi:hypothetical protein